jgi:hypothetical protein
MRPEEGWVNKHLWGTPSHWAFSKCQPKLSKPCSFGFLKVPPRYNMELRLRGMRPGQAWLSSSGHSESALS